MLIDTAIVSLKEHVNLSASQMEAVMEAIMSGSLRTEQIAEFLRALTEKGETAEEIAAAAGVMRRYALPVRAVSERLLDTCGTGGDQKNTFNISTAAAFVASGAGAVVAKHGNRSVSSKSGSADVLEALGINICAQTACIERCLNEVGIAFFFAQQFHPAMKYAMPARRQIGSRTIFNFLGPLSNPAGATHQLLGVYSQEWARMLAEASARLGSTHVLVVHGSDGLDEATTADTTLVFDVRGRTLTSHTIDAREFGLTRRSLGELRGGSAAENAQSLQELLSGRPGAYRDIVVFNAACALYAADIAGDTLFEGIRNGIALAEESIDSGKALQKLTLLKEYTNG